MLDLGIAVLIISFLGVFGAIITIISYIFLIIARWKLFTKAGEAGWKSIIPIYNRYIFYKISWKPTMFWTAIALGIVSGFFYSVGAIGMTVIGTILLIIATVIDISLLYKISKAYGHGAGYTIGLVFLTSIFTLILGLGKSQYVGKNQN